MLGAGLARMAWRVGGLVALLALGAVAFLASCSDSVAPPPPPVATDFTAQFTAASRTFEITPPPNQLLQFVVTGVTADAAAGTVVASVQIRNSGTTRRVGPPGIALSDFAPAGVALGGTAICDPTDTAAPTLPADACLVSYSGSYDADGMLDAGEASRVVTWTFTHWAGGDFSFKILPVATGLAVPGEISGVVFSDDNGNGQRDPEEAGLSGIGVALQYADSVSYAATDPSGRYAFQVTEPGNYLLSKPVTCCTNGAITHTVAIRPQPGSGDLNGYSGGTFGCTDTSPDLPQVAFLDVQRGGGLPPCTGAEPCSIPFGIPFKVRFTGAASCNPLVGIQWQTILPRALGPGLWQPYGSDNLFLAWNHPDTALVDSPGDTIWSVHANVVTLHFRNTGVDTLNSGNLTVRGRAKDAEGLVSTLAGGVRRIAINLDPQTEIQSQVACNCPAPPPSCAARGSVPRGWITGVDSTEFSVDAWIPFCEGDTLPALSHVRFFVQGRDDPRDLPIDPAHGLLDVGFSYRFTTRGADFVAVNMPFSSAWRPADHPLPGGGSWHGGASGWQICPFDYTFFASAVDEHGKSDGTPDSLVFFSSGAPAIDSVITAKVIVLVPDCPSGCAGTVGPFGSDTLMVRGTYIQDTTPPIGPGWNRFTLPFGGIGHDHPRDRNAPGRDWYLPQDEGRVRGWRYSLDCLGGGCEDILSSGEDAWFQDIVGIGDPPGRQVFDTPVEFTLPLVPCTSGCPAGNLMLGGATFGLYEFAIGAHDNDFGDPCFEPSDLGPHPAQFERHTYGRMAQARRTIILRQLRDVRPSAAAAMSRAPRIGRRQAMR